MTSRLWRTCGVALVLASLAETLLASVTNWNDTFTIIITITAWVSFAGLIVCHYIKPLERFLDEILILTMVMWLANAIEFVIEDGPPWDSRLRGAGFYVAFAIVSLGMYLVFRNDKETANE